MKARHTFGLTYRLLPPADRRRFVALVVMSLVGAAFESLGIGVVIPVVATVAGAGAGDGLLGQLYGLFGPRSLGWACGALVVVFSAKSTFLMVTQYLQFRFIHARQAVVGRQLLASVLARPYVEHARRSSATLLAQINDDVRYAHQVVLQTAFTLVGEIAVGLLVAALLFALAPLVAAAALVLFGLAALLISLAVRRSIEGFGARQQREHGAMNRYVIQALRSLKETKLAGKEPYFVEAYGASAERFARSMRVFRAATAAPRHVLEALAAAALVATLLVGHGSGMALPQLLPLLALLVVAAVRLMPSISRLLQSITTLRHFARSVYVVHELLGDAPTRQLASGAADDAAPQQPQDVAADAPALRLRERVELRGVSFRYPESESAALSAIDLTLSSGEIVGLVGESGAGKSTLADVLLGLLSPDVGELLVDGTVIDDEQTRRRWQRALGVVPQPVYLVDDTVRRNVAFACADDEIDDERVERALRAARLWDFVCGLPNGLDHVVGEDGSLLSGGERQRVGIARALYREPTLLVLDEGTSALDYRNEREIALAVDALAEAGTTVVIIAHRLSTLRLCQRLVMLEGGRIVASGTFDELSERSEAFGALTA